MVDDGGDSRRPLVVSSSQFEAIEGFGQKLFKEEPHQWGAIVPWDYPTTGTKESEDDFLRSQFSAIDFEIRETRFLAQVWKCIALYNAQCRIPAVVEQWIQDHSQGCLDDVNNASHIFKDDFNMTVFFQTSDLALYGDAFLKHVVKCIQFRLLQMEPPTKVAEVEKARTASAHAAASARTTSAEGTDRPMSGPKEMVAKATSPVTTPQEASIMQATPPASKMQVIITSQVPGQDLAAPLNEQRPRRNSGNTHDFGERRSQQFRKQRGNHNNKRNSFGRGQNRPPPGLAGLHQAPMPYEPQYSTFRSTGSEYGLPHTSTSRVPSGGPYFSSREPMPPIVQGQQAQAPISGAYLSPNPMPPVTHCANDQHRMRDPYALTPGSLGTPMNPDSAPFAMPRQVQPFMDNTNVRANAVSYGYDGNVYGNESRGYKRRDSVSSRGKRGSLRGRGSRGRNNIEHLGIMPATEASDQRRFSVTRERNQEGESWRTRIYDENTTPRILHRQDARFSMAEHGFPANDGPQCHQPVRQAAATSDNFEASAGPGAYRHQTRQLSTSKQSTRQSDPLCDAGCTGSSVGAGCLTALKVIVFNAPAKVDSHSVWHFFSSFGDLWNVSDPMPSITRPDKHHIWVHFKDVMATRKCLTARGQPWPGGQQLSLEIAQQHHDPNHHTHKSSLQSQHFPAPTAMPFVPSDYDQGLNSAAPVITTDSQTLPCEPTAKAVASADNIVGMTFDVASIGSGATTPKKKGKSSKQKKRKQTLHEDALPKDLVDNALRGDEKPSGDEPMSVSLADTEKADVVATKKTTDDGGGDVVASATEQSSLNPSILSKLSEDGGNASSISACTSADTDLRLTSAQLGSLDIAPPDQESTETDETKTSAYAQANDISKAKAQQGDRSQDVTSPGPHKSGNESDSIELSDQAPAKDDPSFSELDKTIEKAASPSLTSPKGRKKAPIPRVPVSRASSIVLPSLCNKKSYTPSEETGDQVPDDDRSSQTCNTSQPPKQPEASGNLDATKTSVTAPATPVMCEEQPSQNRSLSLAMSKSKKAAKPKGPAQTESFSMFASKTKKEKRKTSKPVSTSAKDTKKDGIDPCSTTVQNKSPTDSGFVISTVSRRITEATDASQPYQPDQLSDAINIDAHGVDYDNALSAHRPSVSGSGSHAGQAITSSTLAAQDNDFVPKSVAEAQQEHAADDSKAVAESATAGQASAVGLVTEMSTSSPRPSRRGTIGGLFDSILKPIIGRGSSKSSQQDDDETYSASKLALEDNDAAVGTDSKLPVDQKSSTRTDTRNVSSGMTGSQPELAVHANKDTKKKPKKPKKSKTPRLGAIMSDGDTLLADTDDKASVVEHMSSEAASESSSQTIDNVSRSSNRSPGKKVAMELQKPKHIIEPKPSRNTHKRAASSKASGANIIGEEAASLAKTTGAWRASRAGKQVSDNDPSQSSSSSSSTIVLIVVNNPVDENQQTLEADRIQNRIEDVTEARDSEFADGKVFDSKKKADTESRVSPEVEDAKARLNELAQREQKIKANKAKEVKEQGDMQ